jgi:hypothetical protein
VARKCLQRPRLAAPGLDWKSISSKGSQSFLGVDVKVILTPPCIFCMKNH